MSIDQHATGGISLETQATKVTAYAVAMEPELVTTFEDPASSDRQQSTWTRA